MLTVFFVLEIVFLKIKYKIMQFVNMMVDTAKSAFILSYAITCESECVRARFRKLNVSCVHEDGFNLLLVYSVFVF